MQWEAEGILGDTKGVGEREEENVRPCTGALGIFFSYNEVHHPLPGVTYPLGLSG